LEVTVGTTVTWTNAGERNHTATSDDDVFGSDRLGSGDTFSFTFEEAGTFPYRCELHESMRATIVVAEE
jgi:plastocyanin